MVSLLFVAFMKPEFAKVFAHTFFHHLFYKDYFHSFINFVSFSPLWRSVVLHICQLHDSNYHIQKQHQSPSSDETHFPGASVEILRLERFCELREILNSRDHQRHGQDRKLLNFTHWLHRTSMKYSSFEGKYLWIKFSKRSSCQHN